MELGTNNPNLMTSNCFGNIPSHQLHSVIQRANVLSTSVRIRFGLHSPPPFCLHLMGASYQVPKASWGFPNGPFGGSGNSQISCFLQRGRRVHLPCHLFFPRLKEYGWIGLKPSPVFVILKLGLRRC